MFHFRVRQLGGEIMKGYFKDRFDAGKKLAVLLEHTLKSSFGLHNINNNVVVYALPRGGVILGAEIAKKLGCSLDLIITRKIGHPYIPEYAIGATTEEGDTVFDKDEILTVDPDWYRDELERERLEAKRRRELFLGGKYPIGCRGKTAILVDDGIATGLTMKAAIKELETHYKPEKIIVATGVISRDMFDELNKEGVEVVSVIIDHDLLGSVGAYYREFSQVEDMEVVNVMKEFKGYSRFPIQSISSNKIR